MSKKNKEVNNKEQEEPKQAGKTAESAENKAGNEQKGKEEAPEVDEEAKKIEQKLNTLLKENEELKASVAKEKDDYIRLMADFENFRRHSAEAKLELVSSAAADTIKGLLSVDKEAWLADVENIKEFYKFVGDSVPAELYDELKGLEERLSK